MVRPRGAAVLAAAVLAFAACSGPTADQPVSTPEPVDGAVRMAAVGDSITDADSPDFAAGDLGPQSWVTYAVGEDVEFAGGWAVWGASTQRMAAEVDAFDAEVLVILGGTNDATVMGHEQIGANLVGIASAAQVPQVVLSSIPPIDSAPESATSLNAYLEEFAAEQDWVWVDSAAGLREGNRFADGMAYDGLHPTEAGAQVIGTAIGAAVVQAAR